MRIHALFVRILITSTFLFILMGAMVDLPVTARASGPEEQYIVVANPSSQSVNATVLRAHGHGVINDMSQAGVFTVQSNNPADLEGLPGVIGIAEDRPVTLTTNETGTVVKSDALAAYVKQTIREEGCASTMVSCPLQWDRTRIHLPQAWKTTQGSPDVKVAVIDTGLTSTHEEVGSNYGRTDSRSFVRPNNECPASAMTYSSLEDFVGHGTATATQVAGKDGALMTGIAPKTTLINVRVFGACGETFHSWIMEGMLYANQVGAQIASMSVGGFICGMGVVAGSPHCGSQEQVGNDPIIYRAYQQIVNYLRAHGTLVIAAIGNNHVQINQRGMVINHGSTQGINTSVSNDNYGQTTFPAGIPGVFAVSAINRINAAGPSSETLHGRFGVGSTDQLAEYSSYGEAIDVSAPGGSPNYNVPGFDCITPNCVREGPSASGATDNPGIFIADGVDANFNPCNNCYMFVEGTSLATPQVSGVAALLLAVHPHLSTDELFRRLKQSVTPFSAPNETPTAESDPNSPGYLSDLDYDGPGIPNYLMGSGVIDAEFAVQG